MSDCFPAVDVLAWRPHLAAAGALAAAALAVRPRTRRVAAAVAAVAAVGGAPAVVRALPRRAPPPAADDVSVLVLNVLRGRADTGAVATLIERAAPDLVVLPEAGDVYCAKLVPLVAALGYRGVASTPLGVADGWGVTVLAGPRATGVQLQPGRAMRLRHVEASGGLLGHHTVYAVHATAPMGCRSTAAWRRDLTVAAGWGGAAGGIVAGDLNATRDHRLLRAVGSSAGRGATGTWPAVLPRLLGLRIDHVLLPPGVTCTAYAVHDVPGTDHRAVEARLRLSGTAIIASERAARQDRPVVPGG